MFENNDVFEKWLDKKSFEIIENIDKKQLTTEEMLILVLKAQSNHFSHLDQDLRTEMKELRVDMDKRFERSYKFMQWQTGLGVVAMAGIYLKLFFV